MKHHTKTLLASLTASAMIAGSASAGTIYTWTGTTSNNLNVATNWAGGVAPTDVSDQPKTPAADDVIVFDSATWVRKPRTLYTRTNTSWGGIDILNGTVDWKNDGNNQGNHSGFTSAFTLRVGDGDATAARADFNVTEWNDGGGDKTYIINSDGTLASARGGNHVWSSSTRGTIMQIVGGTVDINGSFAENDLNGDATNYVSFEALGSTFTFNKGAAGWFDDASDVTGDFGTTFRLGGALNSGNAALELTDGGSNWTITAVVPEPGSLALLGLGGLLIGARRRRDA